MNHIIEQRIWNYIDGTSTGQEREIIEALIVNDPIYKIHYQELKALNDGFLLMETDEPSMSFTRNVMELVKNEPVPGSLKSLIDKRVIYGIASFFIISLIGMLAYALLNVNWSAESQTAIPDLQIAKVNYAAYLSDGVVKGFIFFDIVIGLFFLDSFLQKKLHHKKASH